MGALLWLKVDRRLKFMRTIPPLPCPNGVTLSDSNFVRAEDFRPVVTFFSFVNYDCKFMARLYVQPCQ